MPYPSLLPRFLRYVKVWTTSDPHSDTVPSTPQQWDLLRLLEQELRELGASDVELKTSAYLLARIPATTSEPSPVVALLAHVDTSPDFSGKDVQPIRYPNYQGQAITYPNDSALRLDPHELKDAIGKELITSSGDTLLGADDKAGVAILMTLAEHLLQNPSIPHGEIRLCFTPDEEIGRGVDGLSLEWLGADVAYTVDGDGLGEINEETFSADGAAITITGLSTHPGTAKQDGMVNAVHLVGKLLASLPRERCCPEDTDGREGFLHPVEVQGTAAEATLRLILRDFEEDGLAAKGEMLRALCAGMQACYPTARIDCRITKQYRNMGKWLRERPECLGWLQQACQNAGITPILKPIRGGTDGSRLTERGLPTPNLFTGGHGYHGPLEWICREDMEASVQVLVELVQVIANS